MQRLSRQLALTQRAFATTARQLEAGGAVPAKKAESAPQVTEAPAPTEVKKQAPNYADIWAPSQKPRSQAMTGPRFEQTDYSLQVRKPPGTRGHNIIPRCSCEGGNWTPEANQTVSL